jgi:hypothetical protein
LFSSYWYLLVPVVVPLCHLAHRVVWHGFCIWVIVAAPEKAAEIIAVSGKWAPKLLPGLPWRKGGT